MEKKIKVFTDGASRGNPGLAGIGIAILDENNEVLVTFKKFIGRFSNNFAEYTGLIEGVKLIKELNVQFDIINFYLDSELVVKQIKGEYKIKNKDLIELSLRFWKDMKVLNKNFTITHVPRDQNKLADKLANESIDENSIKLSDKTYY